MNNKNSVKTVVAVAIGAALFFVLLWTATRSHRKEPILREEKPSPLAWLPMLPAAACVLYRYIVNAISIWGGGA